MTSENDVWIYVYEQGEVRYTDLIETFVDTKKRSKTVLLKYKTRLEAAGKVRKRIGEKTNRPVYYVPEKFHQEVEDLRKERGFQSFLASIEPKWFEPLRRLTDEMRSRGKDPYAIFNEYCFAFIDDEPIAFSKSSVEHIMALDSRIHTRYSHDFRTCMERCRREKRTSESVRACLPVCQEEIGRTVGEYWRKLKKKAEKLPFPQRMWVVEGYSEEEIEKMLAEVEKQYARKQKKKRED